MKSRFGVLSNATKVESKRLTTILIFKLFETKNSLYFYDECTFSLNDFKKKYWQAAESCEVLHLRNPCLRIKLNVIMSIDRVVAFQISLDNHKQEDVEEFVSTVMCDLSRSSYSTNVKYLMLDNNPKNRSNKLFRLASDKKFGLFFITPGTPEHNMAESFFGFLKHVYCTLRNLDRINQAADSQFEALLVVLESMRRVNAEFFSRIRRTFLYELQKTLI